MRPARLVRNPVEHRVLGQIAPFEDLIEFITMQTLKTILYATDFSDLAANAFHAAFALARAHGARLLLLYIKQEQEHIQGEFGLMPPEPEDTDAELLDRLDKLVPEDSPVQVEPLVVHGMAARAIVRVAKEQRCDLIVLGTHGRKGLGRLFHGNVADNVTRLAPCPVLALRSSQTEGEPAEDQHDLVRLAAAANPVLAHIWQQALEQEGIRCQVLGDYLDAGIGDIPGFSAEVWVETADLARAEAILRQHRGHSEEVAPSEYQTENPGS
jgi:nucleotide-binding universal stress UspA family protein